MSDAGNSPTFAPVEPPRKRWPSAKQAAVLFFGGLLLGIGGCAGFVALMNSVEFFAYIFGAGFFVGLFMFLGGCIEVLIIAIRAFIGMFRNSNG